MTRPSRLLRGLLALTLALSSRALAQEAPVSLARFNPPATIATHRQRIQEARPLYMAIKERDGYTTEALALRILLADAAVGLACERLRERIQVHGNHPAGRARAHAEIAAEIEALASDSGFSDDYLWYRGEGGRVDPDFLIYATPHEWVARFYGEVTFEIHEDAPRGVDLNAVNRERYGYYQSLSVGEYLDPKAAAIRNLFDRDEYVIPSHVPNHQVRAVTIRARLPQLLPKRMVRLTGRRRRRYERVETGPMSWVDLRDRRGKVIARFATDPTVPPPDATQPRSRQELEPELMTRVERWRIGGRPIRVLR